MTAQGQSLATIDKERRIGSALSIGMQIASAKFSGSGFKFWHFDANAGSGWNDEIGVAGSPLVFWDVARACLRGMEPMPFFCDIDREALRSLQRRLMGDPEASEKSVLLPGDNEEAIEVFAETIRRSERPEYAVGSVLVDPNGYFYRGRDGKGPPSNALGWFCREFPRIDVVLNLNIRTYSMQLERGHAVIPPDQVLASLRKRHWLVGRAYVAQSRFLLAIGRNVATGDHRRLRLYDSGSVAGRLILDAAAGRRQQEIGYDLSDVPGLPFAPGVPGGQSGRVSESVRQMRLRRIGDRSSSPPIPAVGDVRRAGEPAAGVSRLPLFGAREG